MAEQVRAEMVANVMEVVTAVGSEVAEGETIVLLESRGREIPVRRVTSGTVREVAVAAGDVTQAAGRIAVIEWPTRGGRRRGRPLPGGKGRPRLCAVPVCEVRQTVVRVRLRRRLRARRSSSLMPPHTPASWPDSSAQVRHSAVTGQRLQTIFASAICARAGPELPTGKNSSGSSSRQMALWRQSMGNSNRYETTLLGYDRAQTSGPIQKIGLTTWVIARVR